MNKYPNQLLNLLLLDNALSKYFRIKIRKFNSGMLMPSLKVDETRVRRFN